jgi:hypothetical protein
VISYKKAIKDPSVSSIAQTGQKSNHSKSMKQLSPQLHVENYPFRKRPLSI